jgi:hypothetical protein
VKNSVVIVGIKSVNDMVVVRVVSCGKMGMMIGL